MTELPVSRAMESTKRKNLQQLNFRKVLAITDRKYNQHFMKKKILIFGAGVIGSTYGGLLAKSGQEVTLLARNKRYDDLLEKGLLISKINQETPERVNVRVVDEVPKKENYDYVIVALRNEQVSAALPTLANVKSPCFVFMVNNASGYQEWINTLGNDRVLPAFPGSGGRIGNGIVYYQIVSKSIQPTTIGELKGSVTARLKELKSLLNRSGFHASISKNMDAWQKSHIAMIAPLASVIYLDGGNNYTVSKNKEAIRQMNLAIKENFRFLKDSKIGIEPFKLSIFLILPTGILNIIMKYIFDTKWAETVICNHALIARHEIECISRDFISLADKRGYNLAKFKKLLDKSK